MRYGSGQESNNLVMYRKKKEKNVEKFNPTQAHANTEDNA